MSNTIDPSAQTTKVTLPLPFLKKSQNMAQYVLDTIKQVPLTSLTDLTDPILALYPPPIAMVVPTLSSYPTSVSTTSFPTSHTSPHFSFSSHPLLPNTFTDPMIHHTFTNDDPLFLNKLIHVLNPVSTKMNPLLNANASTPILHPKEMNTLIKNPHLSFSNSSNETDSHSIHKQTKKATVSYPNSSSISLSPFFLPNSIFDLIYPTIHASVPSSTNINTPSILESHREVVSGIQTILDQPTTLSSSMPISRKKKKKHGSISHPNNATSPISEEKSIAPSLLVSPTPSSTPFFKEKHSSSTPTKITVKNDTKPCSSEMSSSNHDAILLNDQENNPILIDANLSPLKRSFSHLSKKKTLSNTHHQNSTSSKNDILIPTDSEDEICSSRSKKKKRKNHKSSSSEKNLLPCPLVSPTSSTILDSNAVPSSRNVPSPFSLDAPLSNSFPTPKSKGHKVLQSNNDVSTTITTATLNFTPSNLTSSSTSTRSSLKHEASAANPLKKESKKLESFVRQLQHCTDMNTIDSIDFPPNLMNSLFHALSNKSSCIEVESASMILTLALKYVDQIISVDLFEQPEESKFLTLQDLMHAMEAVQLTLKLLQLHPQLTKENILSLVITTINEQVRKCILPMLEYMDKASSLTKTSSGLPTPKTMSKKGLDGNEPPISTREDTPLLEEEDPLQRESTIKLFKRFLYLICNLIQQIHDFFMHQPLYLTDSMAISACYGLLYPLFTEIPMEELLILRATELVRLVFHFKPNLRIGILDELLCQLIHSVSFLTSTTSDSKKLAKSKQFKLIDGQSIHLFSALLLHLVQSTLSPMALSLDPCPSLCLHILHYFISRATKATKKSEFTNECDYLVLLKLFTEDLFLVLNTPEFPCSELFCRTLLQLFFTWMQEERTSDLPMKSFAMDVFSNALSRLHSFPSPSLFPSSKEYKMAQSMVSNYFNQACKFDPPLLHAFHYYQVEWKIQEKNDTSVASDTPNTSHEVDDLVDDENEEGKKETNAWRKVSMKPPTSSFVSSHSTSIDDTAIDRETCLQYLTLLFPNRLFFQQGDPLLLHMLDWFESKDIHIRSRAIRVLSHTIEVNPSLMYRPNVERAIQSRLLDSSASVRDSVLEALGKWLLSITSLVDHPQEKGLNSFYFEILLGRILDKATSVRKRALKTLSKLQPRLNLEQQIQVAVKMVGRFQDEEESIFKLAQKLLCPFLIPELISLSSSTSSTSTSTFTLTSLSSLDQSILSYHSQVFCGLVKLLPQLDSFMTFLTEQATMSSSSGLLALSLSYFQQLNYKTDSLDLYRAFHLLIKAHPAWITLDMFFYFKSQLIHRPDSNEAWTLQSIQLSLLHIFLQSCNQTVPKKELIELEILVCKIILSGTMMSNVHESVHILCEIVRSTDQMDRFSKLKEHALQTFSKSTFHSTLDSKLISELRRVLILLGTFYAYPALSNPKEIQTFVNQVLALFSNPNAGPLFSTAFTCLGWVFMATPSLVIQPPILQLIHQFLHPTTESTSWSMIEVIVEFLYKFMLNEDKASLKKLKKENGSFDRKAFLGTSDEFAQSGISESLAQTFVTDLVTCALQSTDLSKKRLVEMLQELLGYIAMNRLAHPKFVMPAVIALSTSPFPYIAAVAQMQHAKLHSQHRSILYDHLKEAMVSTYRYRLALGFENGIVKMDSKPTALFHPWFHLLHAHKKDRQQFLHHLLMFFEPKEKKKKHGIKDRNEKKEPVEENEVDVRFFRWVAEQLLWLDYKFEEDLLFILRFIDKVVVEHSESLQQELKACLVSTTLSSSSFAFSSISSSSNENFSMALNAILLLQLRRYLVRGFQLKRLLSITMKPFSGGPKRTKLVHRSTFDLTQFQFQLPLLQDQEGILEHLQKELDQAMIQLDSEEDTKDPSEESSGIVSESVTEEEVETV